MKVDRNGGEKIRRIELGEVCGRGMEEIPGETINTEVKTNHRVTQIYQKQLLRFFTSVCFIERKRKKLRRGVVCGSCFREWAVTQMSEILVLSVSESAIIICQTFGSAVMLNYFSGWM